MEIGRQETLNLKQNLRLVAWLPRHADFKSAWAPRAPQSSNSTSAYISSTPLPSLTLIHSHHITSPLHCCLPRVDYQHQHGLRYTARRVARL